MIGLHKRNIAFAHGCEMLLNFHNECFFFFDWKGAVVMAKECKYFNKINRARFGEEYLMK